MYQQSPYYQPPPEPEPRPSKRRTNRLQIAAGIALIVAVAVSVIVISQRLSDQALAVLAGSTCGVGAAIPTSLLIVAVSRRRDEKPERRAETPQPAYPYTPQPPVIMIAPPGYQQQAPAPRPEPTMGYTEAPRKFTVLGAPGQQQPGRWDGPGWEDDPQ